jgi:hypothetical protein
MCQTSDPWGTHDMQNADAVAFLTDTHRTLARQQDLSPNNPEVNICLGALVARLRAWQAAGFGDDLCGHPDLAGAIDGLPRLCGAAEAEMEKWWCRKILATPCPGAQSLAAFWYLDEYRALCQSELRLLGDRPGERFAFLGSGALPLTAILLAQNSPDVCVTCVDQDGEACELAARLVALLSLSDRVAVSQGDARDHRPVPGETVICASLLNAPGLYARLAEAHAERLVIRDAEGVYRFCYRPAPLPGSGFVQRAKSPVSAQRINTSRYFEAHFGP